MILASFIQTIAMVANIIAAQNEKAAIIQMIGYVSLIYAFLGDYFIFNMDFSPLQLIGVTIVFIFSVTMILYNCTHQPKVVKQKLKEIELDLLLPE